MLLELYHILAATKFFVPVTETYGSLYIRSSYDEPKLSIVINDAIGKSLDQIFRVLDHHNVKISFFTK